MSKNFIIMLLSLFMIPISIFIHMYVENQNGAGNQAKDNEEQSEYLNFKALGGDAKIYLVGKNEAEKLNLLFSYDKKTWFEFRLGKDPDSGISIDSGKTVYISTTDKNGAYPGQGGWHFIMDVKGKLGEVRAGGNIMSLVNADFTEAKKITKEYGFYCLFEECTSLTKAPDLPAEILSSACYSNMFKGCINLTEAPNLNAKVLETSCYAEMFRNCTRLYEAPKLPAKKLAPHCYSEMFRNCTRLYEAPELPAKKLAPHCYYEMFYQCSDLTKTPTLPATILAESCYCRMFYGCKNLFDRVPKLPAKKLAYDCYEEMFRDCENLCEAPELPATTLEKKCYYYMFRECKNLIKAPDLPARDLETECYLGLFYGCKSLMDAPELPATDLAVGCYASMFSGCSSLIKAPKLPAKHLDEGCYYEMFALCKNLTEAPEISAENLATDCCKWMFERCKSLARISVRFKKWNGDSTYQWLGGTHNNGVFVCPKELNVATRDISRVPQGWEIKQTVTVIFDKKNGEEPETQIVEKGKQAERPVPPVYAEHEFIGWVDSNDNIFDFSSPIRDNSVFCAKWAKTIPQIKNLRVKNKGNKSVTITWDKINNYDDIKYEVYYGDSPGSYTWLTTASNVYKDTHVEIGEKHYYWVRGIYTYEKETIKGESSEIITASPSLSRVTGLNAKGLNAAKIQVEWEDENNKDVSYQVYRSMKEKSGFKRVATVNKKIFSQLISPSETNVKYYYKVRAIFKDNMGRWHFSKFSKVDYAYPRVWVPTNFKAWASGKHTAKCLWDKVAGKGIKYLVYRGDKPTGNWGNAIAVTKNTHFINKHLKSAHKYYYMVRAMQVIKGKRYYSSYSNKDYAYPR